MRLNFPLPSLLSADFKIFLLLAIFCWRKNRIIFISCVDFNVILLKADVTMWLCLCSAAVPGLDFAFCLTSLAVRTELYITIVLCTTDHCSVNIYISLFSTTVFWHLCRAINRADRYCLCQSLTQMDQHIHFLHFTQYFFSKYRQNCVISGFRRELDKNCVLLGNPEFLVVRTGYLVHSLLLLCCAWNPSWPCRSIHVSLRKELFYWLHLSMKKKENIFYYPFLILLYIIQRTYLVFATRFNNLFIHLPVYLLNITSVTYFYFIFIDLSQYYPNYYNHLNNYITLWRLPTRFLHGFSRQLLVHYCKIN